MKCSRFIWNVTSSREVPNENLQGGVTRAAAFVWTATGIDEPVPRREVLPGKQALVMVSFGGRAFWIYGL